MKLPIDFQTTATFVLLHRPHRLSRRGGRRGRWRHRRRRVDWQVESIAEHQHGSFLETTESLPCTVHTKYHGSLRQLRNAIQAGGALYREGRMGCLGVEGARSKAAESSRSPVAGTDRLPKIKTCRRRRRSRRDSGIRGSACWNGQFRRHSRHTLQTPDISNQRRTLALQREAFGREDDRFLSVWRMRLLRSS